MEKVNISSSTIRSTHLPRQFQAHSTKVWAEKERSRLNRGRTCPDRIESSASVVAGSFLNRNLFETQFQRLLSMIGTDEDNSQQLSGNNIVLMNYEWIVDTRASMHMTGCAQLLTNLRPIATPSPVYIPNGKSLQATRVGTITLGGISLNDVLLVPRFDCNLIFVAN